jgi:RNA polymerase sigma-70 factor (ECF subfamily)
MEDWGKLARALGDDDVTELATAVQQAYEVGKARWPVTVEPTDYVAHLALHLAPEDRVAQVQALAAEDFYLACACALEVPRATNELDAHFIAQVPAFIAHVDGSPAFTDEIRQQLRERLLIKTPERRARIADYSGRGSLVAWLRVAAVRLALNHVKSPHQARRVDDAHVLDELAEEPSAELQVLRAQHGEALADAIRAAVATLGPEQRVILRMYFSTGQSTDTIATILRVNRSTAARRLVAARRAVYEETKRILQQRFPISTRELTSVVRALQGQLNVSLTGLLSEPEK